MEMNALSVLLKLMKVMRHSCTKIIINEEKCLTQMKVLSCDVVKKLNV